jgi:hypothetical protein
VARFAFLWLNRQRLGPVTLVPIALSAPAFAGASWRGVAVDALA